jgi:hypothetical protein
VLCQSPGNEVGQRHPASGALGLRFASDEVAGLDDLLLDADAVA